MDIDPSKKTILVVDDEIKILEVVKSYLENSGYNVLTAKTGKEAISVFNRSNISLILLDLMLPDFSGEELCKGIRKKFDIPIIIVSAKIDEKSIIYGLNIGADDYIKKPFSPKELLARVSAILRRSEGFFDNHFLRYDNLSVDIKNRKVFVSEKPIVLTPNEYKILLLLMSRPQKVFTRDEIILNVKDDSYDGFDRAIDSHIKNIRHKIKDDPKSPKYITTVYGVGYRFGN
jgi:DNA-binding response OmpR family regulator